MRLITSVFYGIFDFTFECFDALLRKEKIMNYKKYVRTELTGNVGETSQFITTF